jgi:hypothetical protein
MALAGLVLWSAAPESAGAQTARVFQVWTDRSIGVTSGFLAGVETHASTLRFPVGVTRVDPGELVRGRTYLHFPMDLFPAGTDVVQATLYAYFDSASSEAPGKFGVYRVTESWGEALWSGEPAEWPPLMAEPLQVRQARFQITTTVVLTPTRTPILTPIPTATPAVAPSPTVTPTATATPAGSPLPTPTAPESPLPTLTPTPTPTPAAPSTISTATVDLEPVEGQWLTWDVTAFLQAWLRGEVPNYGLALASAPSPNADLATAGDLLAARALTWDDPETLPYLIVDVIVRPVTPTPFTSPLLPPAGQVAPVTSWRGGGLLLIGVALVLFGLALTRR